MVLLVRDWEAAVSLDAASERASDARLLVCLAPRFLQRTIERDLKFEKGITSKFFTLSKPLSPTRSVTSPTTPPSLPPCPFFAVSCGAQTIRESSWLVSFRVDTLFDLSFFSLEFSSSVKVPSLSVLFLYLSRPPLGSLFIIFSFLLSAVFFSLLFPSYCAGGLFGGLGKRTEGTGEERTMQWKRRTCWLDSLGHPARPTTTSHFLSHRSYSAVQSLLLALPPRHTF